MVIIIGRSAGQDPVHRGPTLVAVALILVIKVRAVRVVITNSLLRATSNMVISEDTRVIQSSSMVASTMFLPPVFVNEIRRFISVRSIPLSRPYLSTCDGQNIQSHGVGKITRPGLRIWVIWLWW